MYVSFRDKICLFSFEAARRRLSEIEFLDISLTKDSSLLLHAIRILFYWRILQKTIIYSGFKNPYKKIRETRKLECIHEWPFVKFKNEGRNPETSTKNGVQEFHLSIRSYEEGRVFFNLENGGDNIGS